MKIEEAVETLADWAICSLLTPYSCESCSRYSRNHPRNPCKNAVTEADGEEAFEVLFTEDNV